MGAKGKRPPGGAKKDDLARLQGTWNVVALEADGNVMPESMFENARIVIRGDRFESLSMGATYRGTVELDASSKPKQFDLKFTAGHARGTTNFGIYELDGDTWKLCLDTSGKERPKAFATKAGSGLALETLRRASANEKPLPSKSAAATSAASAPAERGAGPATEFEGEWAMASGVFNGAAMDKSMVQWVKRVTQGNQTTVLAGPQVMLKVEFTHDPSKSPKTIDYVNLAGSNKGKTQLGIYEFAGETMQFCLAAPGKPRPADFASKPGDGRSFTVWKLLKS